MAKKKQKKPQPETMDKAQAAKALGVSLPSINKYIASGKLVVARRYGQSPAITVESVNNFERPRRGRPPAK